MHEKLFMQLNDKKNDILKLMLLHVRYRNYLQYMRFPVSRKKNQNYYYYFVQIT